MIRIDPCQRPKPGRDKDMNDYELNVEETEESKEMGEGPHELGCLNENCSGQYNCLILFHWWRINYSHLWHLISIGAKLLIPQDPKNRHCHWAADNDT